jgi:hypothetical protein
MSRLTADIRASQYGRYGYRKSVAGLLRQAGWAINDKRIERIWRREGLKVPSRQPRRASSTRMTLVAGMTRCGTRLIGRTQLVDKNKIVSGITKAPPKAQPLDVRLVGASGAGSRLTPAGEISGRRRGTFCA